MLTKDKMHELEITVDSSTLAGVLEALREICLAKSQHIDENWQDRALAQQWESAARKLDSAYADALKRGL
jgi:hypothetical protein